MRAAIYCRISNDPSGRAAGVERQEAECRELVDRRGWATVEVFTDNDVKATARRRPAFDSLMRKVESGSVEAIVAWKDDRLLRGGRSRWAQEFLTLIRDRRVPVVFVQGQDWDFSTAQGRLLVEMRLSIAAYEVEQAGERQEARWRQRKRDGKLVTLGRRPFGLRRQGDSMVPVKKEAEAIRRAARLLIKGRSLYSVVKDLPPTPYGGTWSPSHFKRALLSDHLVRYGVLDQDTHRLVAARLETAPQQGVGRPRREYALGGLVFCAECGSRMAGSSGGYVCQNIACGGVRIKADLLDSFVLEELSGRVRDEDLTDDSSEPEQEQAPVLRELAEIEDRIATLAEDLSLSEAVLARRVKALESRRDELAEALGRPRQQGDPMRWLAEWAEAGMPEPTLPTDEDSRALYRTLIEAIRVKPASRGKWTPTPERVDIAWR